MSLGSNDIILTQNLKLDVCLGTIERIPAPIVAWDKNGTIQICNKRAQEMLGYEHDELKGRKIQTVFVNHHDTLYSLDSSNLESTAFRVQTYCKNSALLKCEVTANVMQLPEEDIFLKIAHLKQESDMNIQSVEPICDSIKKHHLLVFAACSAVGEIKKVAIFDSPRIERRSIGIHTGQNLLNLVCDESRLHIQNALDTFKEQQGVAKMQITLRNNWGIFSNLELTIFTTDPDKGIFFFLRLPNVSKSYQKSQDVCPEPVVDIVPYILHDVRTCAHNIIFAANLLPDELVALDQDKMVSSLRESSRQLIRTISNFLDIKKLQENKLGLVQSEVNLKELIFSVVQQHRACAAENHVSLEVEYDSLIPIKVLADSLRLSQVLINLINNAIKFTKPKGEGLVRIIVRLDTQVDTKCIEFTVSDTGIGISQSRLAYIFDKFTQEDVSIAQTFGGSGLGLTLSKYLVELMHGSISVTSKVGEGTAFCFKIPCIEPVHKMQFDGPEAIQEVKRVDVIGALSNLHLNILLVDDNAISRSIAKQAFKKLGANITVVSGIEEALYSFSNRNYSIVFMDYYIGKELGSTCIQKMREIENSRANVQKTPIFFCSAYDVPESEMKQCHADGKIVKPFDIPAIIHICTEKAIRDLSDERKAI